MHVLGTIVQVISSVAIRSIQNRNGRTLQGIGSAETHMDKMYRRSSKCPGCPYAAYEAFYDYFGEHGYSDAIVMAAFDGTLKTFPSTSSAGYSKWADFSTYADANSRRQGIIKGSVYMSVWMCATLSISSRRTSASLDPALQSSRLAGTKGTLYYLPLQVRPQRVRGWHRRLQRRRCDT